MIPLKSAGRSPAVPLPGHQPEISGGGGRVGDGGNGWAVPILMGTDAASVGIFGTAHGVSVHGELGLLVRAGLTPIEALRAATSLPAKHFGLGDHGAIAAGLQADLL